MPKLAVPPLSSGPSRVIHTCSHHPRSIPSRRASSHLRPLASAQARHDISLSHSSPNALPPFNFKYSLTDDLNPKNQNDHKPPDERILKLGKSIPTLSHPSLQKFIQGDCLRESKLTSVFMQRYGSSPPFSRQSSSTLSRRIFSPRA